MKKIVSIFALLALIVTVAVLLRNDNTAIDTTSESGTTNATTVPEGDPIDVVNAFYSEWLNARKDGTTDQSVVDISSFSYLSSELQQRLQTWQVADQDPVLCQSELPERTAARVVSQTDDSAEMQVLARGLPERSSRYARVEVAAVDGQWLITDIMCMDAAAEAENSEYSFEKEGYLLKSVPPPLNSEYWHLVFTENDIPGHTAPLLFSEISVCVDTNGIEKVCDPEQFTEPTRVYIQGAMTEAGVDVARVTFK